MRLSPYPFAFLEYFLKVTNKILMTKKSEAGIICPNLTFYEQSNFDTVADYTFLLVF